MFGGCVVLCFGRDGLGEVVWVFGGAGLRRGALPVGWCWCLVAECFLGGRYGVVLC